jgi:hypothetical protein
MQAAGTLWSDQRAIGRRFGMAEAVSRPCRAESRRRGHSGRDGVTPRPGAGQSGAARLHSGTPTGDVGDAGHGRHAGRGAQAGCVALLRRVQGLPAAELFLGRAGDDLVLRVPRRECSRRARTTAGVAGLSGASPVSATKVSLRSDMAGYQEQLLLYCGEGKELRFGMIDFAIGADVTDAFRVAAQVKAESEWKPLIRMFDCKPQETDQEWAEISMCRTGTEHAKEGDTPTSQRITGSWRSASRCASYPWVIRRSCRSRRRNSARRGPASCSAS